VDNMVLVIRMTGNANVLLAGEASIVSFPVCWSSNTNRTSWLTQYGRMRFALRWRPTSTTRRGEIMRMQGRMGWHQLQWSESALSTPIGQNADCCVVCKTNKACANFPLQGGTPGHGEVDPEDMICYHGGETIFNNHQMCDVTSTSSLAHTKFPINHSRVFNLRRS
jgi:hypothetical protein